MKLVYGKFRDNPESPKHAMLSPFSQTIYVPSDDPSIPSHIALSHELAHMKLGHMGPSIGSDISHEYQAVELQIDQLMNSHEYTPEARDSIVFCLSSYVGERVARDLVDSIEKRVRRQRRVRNKSVPDWLKGR